MTANKLLYTFDDVIENLRGPLFQIGQRLCKKKTQFEKLACIELANRLVALKKIHDVIAENRIAAVLQTLLPDTVTLEKTTEVAKNLVKKINEEAAINEYDCL